MNAQSTSQTVKNLIFHSTSLQLRILIRSHVQSQIYIDSPKTDEHDYERESTKNLNIETIMNLKAYATACTHYVVVLCSKSQFQACLEIVTL